MRLPLLAAALAAAGMAAPAQASQSPVAAYVQQAFGTLPQTNCDKKIGGATCTVPVIAVVNTIHTPGDSTQTSPASGSVRYCDATTTYFVGPIFGLSAYGSQRRSETNPAFANTGMTCQLDINLNDSTMKFIGPTVGGVAPTVTYTLQVLNGMLVGTTPGFTAVIVFGAPVVTPVRRP